MQGEVMLVAAVTAWDNWHCWRVTGTSKSPQKSIAGGELHPGAEQRLLIASIKRQVRPFGKGWHRSGWHGGVPGGMTEQCRSPGGG